jgi:predicted ATPase/class 3 adenylate cyclase
MPNLCRRCGFNNPLTSRFCGNCGNQLNKRVEEKDQNEGNPPSLQLEGKVELREQPPPDFQSRGQRRNVTVLFADLSESTQLSEKIDSEDLYEIIQRFIKMLADTVYRYDGTVDKFTGDGLMALFGAPISHENNAERAIHAAMDMQAGLNELNQALMKQYNIELQMHVGLNSGMVIVGNVGSDQLMDYTAIGETVNLAQRLEAVATPGKILVNESVYRQTRMLFDFESKTGLRLKGITHPVKGYQVLCEKKKAGSIRGLDELRAVMVGRDAELQRLLGAVQSLVERNSGSFVLIRGEAGIGKTRLVSELIDQVEGKFVNIIHGRTLTYRRSVAYWVFQESLRQHIGATSDMPEIEVQSRLSKQVMGVVGTQAEDVLPYLEYMLSLPLSKSAMHERIPFLTADQLRQQIFIAVRNWLVAESQYCPLILVLDDLHWADDASLELLLFLIDAVQANPILICGISRPFEDGILAKIEMRAQNRLGSQYHNIELNSLPPSQSELLFRQLITFPDIPESVRNQIIRRADGIPFYLEEILRMLIDDQVITYHQGRWRLNRDADITNLGVPDNLQALILARFDRLDPTYRRILQAASVIGQEFGLPLLSHLVHKDEYTLRKIMTKLVKRAYLETCTDSTISEYAFRHVLTLDAIYSTLLRKDAAELHGRIADAIEELYPYRLNEFVYLLARHYSLSLKDDKALHYLVLAGEYAIRDYLTTQARTYYEKALDYMDKVAQDTNQALRVYIGLGDVLVFVGEYENARKYYSDALTLIDVEDRAQLEQNIALRRKISTTFERIGDFDRALEHLEAAQKIISESNLAFPVEVAKNLSNTGWINFRRGELDQAEKNLSKALALVATSSQYDVIASIYNRLGGVLYQKDELEQSSYYVRKSLVLREEIGDLSAVARCYNNLGLLAWKQGNWDDALDDFSRSIQLNQNLGDVEAMILLNNNIGLLQTDKGNLDVALEHLNDSLEKSKQVGHITLEGETYLHFSRYYLASEEWEKSLFYSRRALEIFDEIGSQDRLVDLNVSMGEAWFGLRKLEQAGEAWQNALAILSEHLDTNTPSLGHARILRLMGNIKRVQGDYNAAKRDIKASIDQFTTLKNQLELGRTYCDMALLEQELGNPSEARIHAREATFIFRKLGATLDQKRLEELSESLR